MLAIDRQMRGSAIFVSLLFSGRALAAGTVGPPIQIALRECSEVRDSEVERVVAAELGSEPSPGQKPQDPTWIVATCTGDRVVIEVSDAVSRKRLRRSFDFGGASVKSRGRLIGIAASELVLASWAELALRPKLEVEPEGPPSPPERTQAAAARARTLRPAPPPAALGTSAAEQPPRTEALPERERWHPWYEPQPPEQRRFRVSTVGSVRGFLSEDGALWGGGLRVGEEPLLHTSWAIDALVESGQIESYRLSTWTLGAQLYFSGRLPKDTPTHSGQFGVTGRIGAGLRAGVVVASRLSVGSETDLSRHVTPWGWPMLATALTFGANHGFGLELSGEAGYIALPVTSDTLSVSIRGVWVSGQAGIFFMP